MLRCDDMGANLRSCRAVSATRGTSRSTAASTGSAPTTIRAMATGCSCRSSARTSAGGTSGAHWTGSDHAPTAPISGPVFDGSGTGIVLRRTPDAAGIPRRVVLQRLAPEDDLRVSAPWDGALIQPEGGRWQVFARRRRRPGGCYLRRWARRVRSRHASVQTGRYRRRARRRALHQRMGRRIRRGVEGRAAGQRRSNLPVSWPDAPLTNWNTPSAASPAAWTIEELFDDLGSLLPVWSVDAQDELAWRGAAIKDELTARLREGGLTQAQETWALWTLGRIAPMDRSIDAWFADTGAALSPNARIQAIRSPRIASASSGGGEAARLCRRGAPGP